MKKCLDFVGEYAKKWQCVWYNMLIFYSQVAKLYDRPSLQSTVADIVCFVGRRQSSLLGYVFTFVRLSLQYIVMIDML